MFAWGFLFGSMLMLLFAAAVSVWFHRRAATLERRAIQAERLAEIGSLTGGLAHEIKNPLSTVQLNLQLLREDLMPENPSYSRLVSRLDTVHRETTRLREILDDFLRYAGRIELDKRPTELTACSKSSVDFFAPQAQLQRAQLRLKKHASPVVANVDPRLIKQAVLNLLINGLQAIPEGRGGELILSLTVGGKHDRHRRHRHRHRHPARSGRQHLHRLLHHRKNTAPASAWQWPEGSPKNTAAKSASAATSAKGPTSGSRCR
jgi:signal transduction histidine kinase